MSLPKSHAFRKRERKLSAQAEPTGPCTASVRHEPVCPVSFAPLPSQHHHLAKTHYSPEPSIPRDRLQTSGWISLLGARTSPVAKAKLSGHSLPYELDVEFNLPRWLISGHSASTRLAFMALDMNLIKKHQLSPLSVWKSARNAEQFRCAGPLTLDQKKEEQKLHGIPVKPCVLAGGRARLLLMAVEQPTYVKPPEWSPVGLLAVALDQSPVQLTAAVEYSELPYEDVTLCAQVTLMAKTVPATPAALRRVPLNVVCVLDCSEPVLQHKESVQAAISQMMQLLVPQDRLGIVASSEDARVLLELTRMDEEGKGHAAEALEALPVGGKAEITRGLALGVQCMELMEQQEPFAVSTIVLLACGQDPQLRDHIDFLLDRCPEVPCSLYTFALASDEGIDADALPELALRSMTPFTFIEQDATLGERLAKLVDTLSGVVAQQLEATLKPCFEVEEILTPFDCYRDPSDPLSWRVMIPDLSIGETRDIIVKLTVPADARATDGGIKLLEASAACQGHALVEPTCVSIRRSNCRVLGNRAIRDSAERLEVSRILQEAALDADHADFEAAKAQVQLKRQEYEAVETQTPLLELLDQDLQNAEQQFELMGQAGSGADWKAYRPKLFQTFLEHRLQRSLHCAAPGPMSVVRAP